MAEMIRRQHSVVLCGETMLTANGDSLIVRPC